MPAEVVIAGGGPAGTAAAIRLAQAGVKVALLERTRIMHDKVCGEFLSATALTELAALGVDSAPLGTLPIARMALVHGRRSAETSLPFAAQALSRAVLDEALLQHAAAAGVDVRRGVVARLDDLARSEASVFVATGKHDVRGSARATHGFLGFKRHLRLSAAARAELAGRIALFPLAGGYAGVQPLGDGRATFCLAIAPAAFAAAGGTWPTLLETMRRSQPQLDGWLVGAQFIQEKPLAIGRVPYGFVRRGTENMWWLGDQAAVIPSFVGAGIGMALVSARAAAETFLRGGSASDFQARYAAFAAPQVRRAGLVSRLLIRPAWAGGTAALLAHAPMLLAAIAAVLHPHAVEEPGVRRRGCPMQGSVEA